MHPIQSGRGVVPQAFADAQSDILTILDAIREYMAHHAVGASDQPLLNVLAGRLASARMSVVDFKWAQSWVTAMKREENLAPSTVRHYVGALGRCFDWCVLRPVPVFLVNPIRLLPKRYATYSDADGAAVRVQEKAVKKDVERDRRLALHEEQAVRAVLDGKSQKEDPGLEPSS